VTGPASGRRVSVAGTELRQYTVHSARAGALRHVGGAGQEPGGPTSWEELRDLHHVEVLPPKLSDPRGVLGIKRFRHGAGHDAIAVCSDYVPDAKVR
jgi:hypothetical protein